MKVMAIRSAVYMGEGGRSYKHEFDGNDHHATHVLALVDDEPAGCCRIRYFGDFAKPERLAVLPKFRRGRYGKKGVPYEIASYAFEFCAKKGFRAIYGHAVEHLVSFWARFGTEPMPDGTFDIEGYRCVAMAGPLQIPDDAININSGHLVLVRQEGLWHEPGALEQTQPPLISAAA
jgi:GNAT superfamily N-acetyltransferase